jgi:hypothetical protein
MRNRRDGSVEPSAKIYVCLPKKSVVRRVPVRMSVVMTYFGITHPPMGAGETGELEAYDGGGGGAGTTHRQTDDVGHLICSH